MGYSTFIPPAPTLVSPLRLGSGAFQFTIMAYTNRNYVIESSDNALTWEALTPVFQGMEAQGVVDPTAAGFSHRIYRVRLSP
jgi:hypothetical protein